MIIASSLEIKQLNILNSNSDKTIITLIVIKIKIDGWLDR